MVLVQVLMAAALPVLVLAVAAAVLFRRWRLVWINVAAVAVGVLLFSGYTKLFLRVTDEFKPADWSQPHEILGNMARPSQRLHWTKKRGSVPVFDIILTTNVHGFRITPEAPDAKKSLLFFGCSYTFGHGVEDQETYPFRVGEDLGGEFATYNIAFNGWGPHEILAALQSGLVEKIVNEPPELAVFLTITDHVRRVIGREEAPWMARAPRYVLEGDRAVRRGRFEDDPSRKRFSAADRGYWGSFQPEDYQLYSAVVKAIGDEVAQRFPGTRFEVVLWDTRDNNPTRKPLLEALRARGVSTHHSHEFLGPDKWWDPYRFTIARDEVHPNPEGLRLLAQFVETTLLQRR